MLEGAEATEAEFSGRLWKEFGVMVLILEAAPGEEAGIRSIGGGSIEVASSSTTTSSLV